MPNSRSAHLYTRGASGCGPAIRQDISTAFYRSLNQARRILIGVARCVFASKNAARGGPVWPRGTLWTPRRGKARRACMARPKKAPEERRGDQLGVRLTTAERAEVEQHAAALGISAAEFARRRS